MKKSEKKILIVTDKPDACAPEKISGWEITFALPGEDAFEMVQRQSFDLILLDQKVEATMGRKLKAVMPLLTDETFIGDFNNEDGLQVSIGNAFQQLRLSRMNRFVVTDIMAQ